MSNKSWHYEKHLVWKEDGDVIYGFGRKELTLEALGAQFKVRFPERDLHWLHLHQIHSPAVVESKAGEKELLKADAHYSFERGIGLIVKSADCLPVLMSAPPTGKHPNGVICAIHAGWRGIENEVIRAATRKLGSENVDPSTLRVYIGPHIRISSFEVDFDVGTRLKATAKRAGINERVLSQIACIDDRGGTKEYINLEEIARAQLMAEGVLGSSVKTMHENDIAPDTPTTLAWASYRRDGANAGRNLSFVIRL